MSCKNDSFEPLRGNDDGFTLLELLVSIVLLATISALLVGAIRSANIALITAEHSNKKASTHGVRKFLNDALAQARPMQSQGILSGAVPTFHGQKHRLKFITNLEKPGQYGGLYQLEILSEPQMTDRQTIKLVANADLWRPKRRINQSKERSAQKFILMTDISKMSFKYFGSQDRIKAAQWHTSWTNIAHLPTLVAVEINFHSREGARWPRLITKLQLSD